MEVNKEFPAHHEVMFAEHILRLARQSNQKNEKEKPTATGGFMNP